MSYLTARDCFLIELRRALKHLYDPAALGRSPLLDLFGLTNHANPHAGLRRILVEGIQALKPGYDVPPYASAWRIYHVLIYRYVEQSSQHTVSANLGLSIRQLRRQERIAERALADHLWTRYKLEAAAQNLTRFARQLAQPNESLKGGEQEQELQWLQQSLPSETGAIEEIIGTIVRIADPLLRDLGVEVRCQVPQGLPPLAGQLSTVRQGLLSLLTAAARSVPDGQVHILVTPESAALRVHIQGTSTGLIQPIDHQIPEQLEMARRLFELFGGRLEIVSGRENAGGLAASVLLPIVVQVPVLVIDDNADTLRLFERYLTGTSYHFIGARDPEQALALAEKCAPHAIVLDVMLPGIDGWELLGRLREHPRTRHIPIIVCTILPQEQLAMALGAAAFIHKPVSREQLLAVLDQQLRASGPGYQ
ncbi:MAG: response regulator [Anaerolineae bacterium]|nr:response regulator [Anaerolineae bacterium]MDW8099788.1 response regulator [Anaerolineae bacterium]